MLGISNDEAAHLGLSDFSTETAQDADAWAVGFEKFNAERRAQYDLDKAEYDQARARYDQYLRDKAAYDQYLLDRAEHDGTTPEAPPDDGVDLFNPREFEAKTEPETFSTIVSDMNLMDRSFDPMVFTKNRRRLLEHRIGQALFDEVAVEADQQGLLSAEHFRVDGTLIESAASIKSFRRRDEERQPPADDPGNPSVDFRGERRSNETHQSRTGPEAQLMRKGKGKETKLVFMGDALMENRRGMLMDFVVSGATGTAERDAVPVLLAMRGSGASVPRRREVTGATTLEGV